jgi:hypothetical protein
MSAELVIIVMAQVLNHPLLLGKVVISVLLVTTAQKGVSGNKHVQLVLITLLMVPKL